jgi:hypothetical protein
VYALPDANGSPADEFISFTLTGSHVIDGNTVEAKLYAYPGIGQAVALVQTKSFTVSGSVANSITYTWTGFSTPVNDRHVIFAEDSSVDFNSARAGYLETTVTDSSGEISVGYMFGYSFGNFNQPAATALQPNLDFASATTTGLALHVPRGWGNFTTSTGTSLSVGQAANHSASWGDEFNIILSSQATSGGSQNVVELFIQSSGGTRTYLEMAFNALTPIWGATIPFQDNAELLFRLPASGTNGTYDFGYRIKHADTVAEAATLFTLQFDIT